VSLNRARRWSKSGGYQQLRLAWALTLAGCSSPDAPSDPPSGPAMGIVEVDPNSIPLGEGDSSGGGSNAVGGSSHGGGSVGTAGGSTQPGAIRIGKACETSGDCPSGQSCHMDADFISDKQCTLGCEDEAPCKALEQDSFCIGAHVCVHACNSDADCGPKTRCGKAGWCERSGPGSGEPYCGGVATPCSLLSGSSCTLALGCHDDSDCSGVSASCYSQFTSYACNALDGCYWSSSSKSCSGSSHSCFSYSFDFECQAQDGCNWHESCSGSPSRCEDTPVSLCTQQPGCTVLQD
jgi:hypothetical protein